MPRMTFNGVRNSWLTVARKRDLASLAASALTRAPSSARSDTTRSVTSRPTRKTSDAPSGSVMVVSVQAIQRTPPSVSIASFHQSNAVSAHVDRAGLDDLGPNLRAFKRATGNVEQTCVSGIGEGDAPPRIMPDHHVRLRLDETAGALLRLGQPSSPIVGFLQRRQGASKPRRAPPRR